MPKGLGSLIILIVVIAAAGVGLFVANSQFNIFSGTATDERGGSEATAEVTSEDAGLNEIVFNDLMSQLRNALEAGGDISSETYAEVVAKIDGLEERGYDQSRLQEVREILSQFNVGGQSSGTQAGSASAESVPEEVEPSVVVWQYRDGAWEPTGTPPECPEPLVLRAPVEIGRVTAMMYPGQVRGGDFKPHGGFHADMSEGPVEVTAPLDGYVWRVAKFTDEFGVHYMIDIQHECGIMYRLGHLGAVPPKIEAIFNSVVQGAEGDSRTHTVEPVRVELGETIATNIQDGPGFDWGVYDLRKENEASKDPAFRDAYDESDREQAFNAICWLDYLPAGDEALLRSLPTGVEGKTSAYC